MNERQERLLMRLWGAFMLLFIGLPLLWMGGFDGYERWQGGREMTKVVPPLLGFVFGALLCLCAAIVVYRSLRQRAIEAKGRTAPATVTKTVVSDDGTWVVHYAYRDRLGQPREGTFRSDLDRWKAGDKGEIRYADDDPASSVWNTSEAPRAATPPKVPPGSVMKTFLAYFAIIATLSLCAGAAGTYLVWAEIWQREGFLGTFEVIEPWKVFLVVGLISALAAIPIAIVVAFGGTFILGIYAFIRHLIRD